MRNPDEITADVISADVVGHHSHDGSWDGAVLRLAADVPDLLAEVSRLKADNAALNRACSDKDHGIAVQFGRAEGLRMKVDALRAAVDRVRALCAQYPSGYVASTAVLIDIDTALTAQEPCPHDSKTGDEGPIADLHEFWPVRWRCDGCGAISYDDHYLWRSYERDGGTAEFDRIAAERSAAVSTEPAGEQTDA